MIMVVVMTSEEATSKLGCILISLIVLLFSFLVCCQDGLRDKGQASVQLEDFVGAFTSGRIWEDCFCFSSISTALVIYWNLAPTLKSQALYHTISHETMTMYHVKKGQFIEVMIFYSRLRTEPLVSLPVEPP